MRQHANPLINSDTNAYHVSLGMFADVKTYAYNSVSYAYYQRYVRLLPALRTQKCKKKADKLTLSAFFLVDFSNNLYICTRKEQQRLFIFARTCSSVG